MCNCSVPIVAVTEAEAEVYQEGGITLKVPEGVEIVEIGPKDRLIIVAPEVDRKAWVTALEGLQGDHPAIAVLLADNVTLVKLEGVRDACC